MYNIRIHNVLNPSQGMTQKGLTSIPFSIRPLSDIGHRRILPLLVLDPFQVIFIDVPFSLRTRLHIIYIHKHRDRKFTCESFYILTIGFLLY